MKQNFAGGGWEIFSHMSYPSPPRHFISENRYAAKERDEEERGGGGCHTAYLALIGEI